MKHIKFTKKHISMLGNVPDRIVAEKLGVSIQTVQAERVSLGIKPKRQHEKKHLKKLSEKEFSELISNLGVKRDSELSRTFNISREYVRQLRLKNNKLKYSDTIKKAS